MSQSKSANSKNLPAKAPEMVAKEASGQYLHWKHATFGKKPEETKEGIEYKLRLNHIVD